MGLIEDFITRYRKEYDFYDQASRLAAQALECTGPHCIEGIVAV